MAHKIPELLKKMLDVVPGKQTGLATLLSEKVRGGIKISQPQVSRWLKGQEPERHNYDRIIDVATELGILIGPGPEDYAISRKSEPKKNKDEEKHQSPLITPGGVSKSKTDIVNKSLIASKLHPDINTPGAIPTHLLFGERDLPVFGTAEGGEGSILLTNEAVDWVLRPEALLRVKDGYGIIVTGDSMSPEHKSGSIALVNPHLPARAGDPCIFRSHDDDGTVRICIKELVRQTGDAWHVKQHTPPKSITLKKSEWQVCHVTVGNYFRR